MAARAAETYFEQSRVIKREEFPVIVDMLEQICLMNGIHKVPKLRILDYLPSPVALPQYDAIVMNLEFLGLSSEKQLSTLAHEFGHILRGDLGFTTRAQEFATDALSVQMVGGSTPLQETIRYAEEKLVAGRAEQRKILAAPEDAGWLKKLLNKGMIRAMEAGENAQRKRQYGTFEERIANAVNAESADRSVLESLITERNASGIGGDITR